MVQLFIQFLYEKIHYSRHNFELYLWKYSLIMLKEIRDASYSFPLHQLVKLIFQCYFQLRIVRDSRKKVEETGINPANLGL